ncbi:hypothetical protein B0H19DRAFT_1385959 [Mycena capillaripes]|nr:hypothetical protein B0H19DRAFT_1385959 [Mycena capillaripes]
MSLEKAIKWTHPEADELTVLYPNLTSAAERKQAWIYDNAESIEEAMIRIGLIPFYWDPAAIVFTHEGFTYIVSAPHHVAAINAMRDWPTATEYSIAHADSRTAEPPLVFTMPEGWHPDSPAEWPSDREWKPKTRYTVYGWRKQEAFHSQADWTACQHYLGEHYDMKVELDPQGKVVSTEYALDYLHEKEKMSRL